MYSMLCQDLSTALPQFPSDDPDGKPIAFRRIFLNICQEAFEGTGALCDEIKQMAAPEQEAERRDKEKNELLGQDLKAAPAEENVEALCHLFNTVGKQLEENPKSRIINDSYFARMKELSHNPHLAARMKFMIRDVLELRVNKWIPRREEVKAKTINEIHSEAEQKLGLRPGTMNMRNGRGAPGMGLSSGSNFDIVKQNPPLLQNPDNAKRGAQILDSHGMFEKDKILHSLQSPIPKSVERKSEESRKRQNPSFLENPDPEKCGAQV